MKENSLSTSSLAILKWGGISTCKKKKQNHLRMAIFTVNEGLGKAGGGGGVLLPQASANPAATHAVFFFPSIDMLFMDSPSDTDLQEDIKCKAPP